MEKIEYKMGKSRHRFLCRWWLRIRKLHNPEIAYNIGTNIPFYPEYEIYCPLWAKPLDFIYKLIFSKCELGKLK